MLSDQADIEFHYVTDPAAAVATAHQLQPTVILQDLVMPEVDGFTLIREYRDDAALRAGAGDRAVGQGRPAS